MYLLFYYYDIYFKLCFFLFLIYHIYYLISCINLLKINTKIAREINDCYCCSIFLLFLFFFASSFLLLFTFDRSSLSFDKSRLRAETKLAFYGNSIIVLKNKFQIFFQENLIFTKKIFLV